MAEFAEVMRQKHRLCEGNECHVCPLGKVEFCGRYDIDPKCAEQAETIIMQWASEYPEPQYPSWEEWQKENFPDARFELCMGHFYKVKVIACDNENECKVCRKQPIHADIAEILHIPPKGAKE